MFFWDSLTNYFLNPKISILASPQKPFQAPLFLIFFNRFYFPFENSQSFNKSTALITNHWAHSILYLNFYKWLLKINSPERK